MYSLFDVVTQYCIDHRNEIFHQYMGKRGWSEDTVDRWELGYFPHKQILNLKVRAKSNHIAIEDLEDLHVLKKRWGVKAHESIFCGRIIFPVRDEFGKLISITGRTLIEDEKPKYYNTDFEKGNHLYGLFQAIEEIRKRNIVYVFEGNADVITAHQYGIKNTVCVMGTAFRDDHMTLLAGYAKNIVLIFDNDTGGRGALGSFNAKHIEEKRSKGVKLFRCSLKDYTTKPYKDVDDFLRGSGRDEFLAFVDRSIKDPAIQRRLRDVKKDKKVVK